MANPEWDTERAVLGACILGGGDVIEDVAAILTARDFHRPQHGALFALMVDMHHQGLVVDITTVMADVGARDAFEQYAGAAYLAQHPTFCTSLENATAHAERVKLASAKRTTRMALVAGLQRLDGGADVSEVAAETVTALAGAGDAGKVAWRTMPDLCRVTADDILSRDPEVMRGVPTGLRDLDEKVWGLRLGSTSIWAGRPGMGKTAIVGVLARNAAARGWIVGIQSLEMQAGAWIERMAVADSGIDASSVTRGRLTDPDRRELMRAIEDLSELPIYIHDGSGLTPSAIGKGVRRLVRDRGAQLVIVDYLQLVTAEDPRASTEQAVSAISASLTGLAKELNIHIAIACQLNRGTEDRTDHRPTTRDLRGSGSIEQDASLIVFPYREEFYNREDPSVRGFMDLIVVKNRYGESNVTIRVRCDLRWMQITDLAGDGGSGYF